MHVSYHVKHVPETDTGLGRLFVCVSSALVCWSLYFLYWWQNVMGVVTGHTTLQVCVWTSGALVGQDERNMRGLAERSVTNGHRLNSRT